MKAHFLPKPPTPNPSPQRGRGGAPARGTFQMANPGRLPPPSVGEGWGGAAALPTPISPTTTDRGAA